MRAFYFKHHVTAVVRDRAVVRDKSSPRRAFALLTVYMWQHLKAQRLEGAPRVGQFSLALQHGFMRWCRDKHGLSCKTISTYLSLIKAAVRFGATPRLVTDAAGREREVKLLSAAPFIADGEDLVSQVTGLPRSQPRQWIPTDHELAAMLSKLRSEDPQADAELQATFRYCIVALSTMARPEAITELSVAAQVRFDRGIIDMNPPDRPQNKKVRPLIRLTDNLAAWLHYWNLDRPIVYFGRPVRAISNRTLQKAAKAAGVEDWAKFTRYTLRHYMATRVRRVSGITVAREQRAAWMGHVDPQHRTTEHWYESHDPDYLEDVRRAIDAIMLELDSLATVSLLAPGAVAGTRLALLKSETKSKPGRKTGETA